MATADTVLTNATNTIGDAFDMNPAQRRLVRFGLVAGAVYVAIRIVKNLTQR